MRIQNVEAKNNFNDTTDEESAYKLEVDAVARIEKGQHIVLERETARIGMEIYDIIASNQKIL